MQEHHISLEGKAVDPLVRMGLLRVESCADTQAQAQAETYLEAF